MRASAIILLCLAFPSLVGCGHYYRRAYRGATYAHATGATVGAPPTVVVGSDGVSVVLVADDEPFVTSVISASVGASGAWSGEGG